MTADQGRQINRYKQQQQQQQQQHQTMQAIQCAQTVGIPVTGQAHLQQQQPQQQGRGLGFVRVLESLWILKFYFKAWELLEFTCFFINRGGPCQHGLMCGCNFFCLVIHPIFSHLRAHAFAHYVTVARSSAVQVSSSRRQVRMWTIVCGSPQSQSTDWASSRLPHLLITVFAWPTPCAQSVKSSPTEPVLSRSSRQRLGHLEWM